MSTSTLWMNQLASDEGYRRHTDVGPQGSMVIGYGVRLDQGLTQEEARELFKARCITVWRELTSKKPIVLDCLPTIQGILFNLAYTLTPMELFRRRRIWTLITKRQFQHLANELLRMPISKSQPDRTKRLASRCRLSITRVQNNWGPLKEAYSAKRINLENSPHAIQIALAHVLDGTEVQGIMEYPGITKALKKKDYSTTAKEIVECPYLHFPELSPVCKDVLLHRIHHNLNKEDPEYIAWLNSHPEPLPSQHLTHGQVVPAY